MIQSVVGFTLGVLTLPLMRNLLNRMTVEVEDETAVLITQFGKLTNTFTRPGLHFYWEKIFPWTQALTVSLQRDFRQYENIQVNDCRGTTVIIDLWIEFKIVAPEKALFEVENWEESLKSLFIHSATSTLCTQDFNQILCNQTEMGKLIQNGVMAEIAHWGLSTELVMIKRISLLSEVSRHMFGSVAAKLERTKADVEEQGRLRIHELEAEISEKVAQLVAEAKGQYPAAVGRAYAQLSNQPEVLQAYQELYELSLVRPHRTVTFSGFSKGEVREMDAAMIAPPMGELAHQREGVPLPPLSTIREREWVEGK